MDRYNDLKKALHRAIGKAYKNGNSTVIKALDGMPDKQHSLKHIMADLDDSNNEAQVPEQHVPKDGEAVLNKDADPAQAYNQNLKNVQAQKEQNAKAQLGQMEAQPPQNLVEMSEKGVGKLAKFMQVRMTKAQQPKEKDYKGNGLGGTDSPGYKGPNHPDTIADNKKAGIDPKTVKPSLPKSEHVCSKCSEPMEKAAYDSGEKGVNQPMFPKSGTSQAGFKVAVAHANKDTKDPRHSPDKKFGAKMVSQAKDSHKQTLKELKAQPKPNLTKSKELEKRCWKGHSPVPGKKPYSKGSCKKD